MRQSALRALASAAPALARPQAAPAAAAAAAALGARGAKATTGIVGLPVDDQARARLRTKLEEVLAAVQAAIPPHAEYRRSVEATVGSKLAALSSPGGDAEVEEVLGRQLEQEIKLAREELALIPRMAEWAPWEVPEGYTVESIQEREAEAKVGGGAGAGAPPPPPPPPPPPAPAAK
jgi:NADH dehydrogenase (ubiquinone) 1 alpha subcomplex subunit 5